MPNVKLGRIALAKIKPEAKRVIWWDTDLSGFGLVVQPSGAMAWIVAYRPQGSSSRTAPTRLRLGPCDASMMPEQARAQAKDVLAAVRRGDDPAATRAEARKALTLAEVAQKWMADHVEAKRPKSESFYRGQLDVHLLPALGTRPAAAVTRADVAKLHRQIGEKCRVATRPGAKRAPATRASGGPVTANRLLKTISSLYGWAGRMGHVPEGSNPARGVEPFAERGREHFLSPEELTRLGEVLRLAETKGLPWEPDANKPAARLKHAPKAENRREVFPAAVTNAVRLLILSGCRLREILHLRWAEVDFRRGMLRLGDSKTGKKVVVLGGPALVLLRAMETEKLGVYVIASTTAGLKDERPRADLQRPWAAIRRAAGLESTRLHDLRHSFASVGADGRLGLPVIGKLLGHADVKTTQRYAHLSATAERRAADAIGAEIAAAMGLPIAPVIDMAEERRRRA